MNSMIMKMSLAALLCLFACSAGTPCHAQGTTNKKLPKEFQNMFTLKGIAKAVPDTAGSATKHLEMTVAGITYRLKTDLLKQDEISKLDGKPLTVSGTVINAKDKVKVFEVISYEYGTD